MSRVRPQKASEVQLTPLEKLGVEINNLLETQGPPGRLLEGYVRTFKGSFMNTFVLMSTDDSHMYLVYYLLSLFVESNVSLAQQHNITIFEGFGSENKSHSQALERLLRLVLGAIQKRLFENTGRPPTSLGSKLRVDNRTKGVAYISWALNSMSPQAFPSADSIRQQYERFTENYAELPDYADNTEYETLQATLLELIATKTCRINPDARTLLPVLVKKMCSNVAVYEECTEHEDSLYKLVEFYPFTPNPHGVVYLLRRSQHYLSLIPKERGCVRAVRTTDDAYLLVCETAGNRDPGHFKVTSNPGLYIFKDDLRVLDNPGRGFCLFYALAIAGRTKRVQENGVVRREELAAHHLTVVDEHRHDRQVSYLEFAEEVLPGDALAYVEEIMNNRHLHHETMMASTWANAQIQEMFQRLKAVPLVTCDGSAQGKFTNRIIERYM